jgi:hypothetical protein
MLNINLTKILSALCPFCFSSQVPVHTRIESAGHRTDLPNYKEWRNPAYKKTPFDKNNPFHVLARAVRTNDEKILAEMSPRLRDAAKAWCDLIEFQEGSHHHGNV